VFWKGKAILLNMVDVLYPIKITPFISLDNDSSFPFAD
jgi:hypothetical protein